MKLSCSDVLTSPATTTTTDDSVSKLKERSVKNIKDIDFRELSPDDLTKILKLQKEKDINELKTRYLSPSKEQSSKPVIIQQTEDQDSSKDVSRRPTGFPDISSLFPNGIPANIPYAPAGQDDNTGYKKPIAMVATGPDKTLLECECYAKGSRPTNQNKISGPFQQPAFIPISPFATPLGSHFSRKPKPFSHRKPKFNPFEALLMGFIKKPSHKRKPSGPYYPQPMTMTPVYPGYFFPNQIADYGTKGKMLKIPTNNMIPPSPGEAIKGSFSDRGVGDNRSKWYWNIEQYKSDSEKSLSLASRV